MTTPTYHTILAEEAGYALAEIEYDTGGLGYHVVRIDRAAGQVYDARPSDGPDDGGQWCASITAAGGLPLRPTKET